MKEKLVNLYTSYLRKFFGNEYKQNVAKYISELCDKDSNVLDVGCHDGRMSSYILDLNSYLKIEGVDIQENLPCTIKRTKYDGKLLPFPDDHFDIVMAIDMLHHTHDISLVISEMARVSKKYIIIKDVVIYSIFSHIGLCIADYLSNFNYSIKCTYNFPDGKEWETYFLDNNLKIVEQPKKLHFSFFLNERYNPIFKLEKIN